ncbi:hypothetical protein, partial [Mesorhizobium sp. M1A.F.Ca.IN.020.32.1.1]|uniref:hypothetical protein n=1 Tax=Mesorhizobium sp. M1A.F.Ca.IN.020.32.1.1 TaxID=2496763 RepID=UPI0019D4CE47
MTAHFSKIILIANRRITIVFRVFRVSYKQFQEIHDTDPDPALSALVQGNKYPYESIDDQYGDNAPASVDWAHAAARGVMSDLEDRRDIKWALDNIDDDVRVE